MTKETNKRSHLHLPVVDAAAGDVEHHLQKVSRYKLMSLFVGVIFSR
jgi:hypothetical protein